MKRLLLLLLLPFLLATVPSKPYTFTANTLIQSAQVNSDFDTLYSTLSANLDSSNFSLARGLGANYIQSSCAGCTGVFNPGGYTFTAASASTVPLAILSAASPTADILDVCGSSCTSKFLWVDSTGLTHHTGGTVLHNGALIVTTNASGTTVGDAAFGLTSTGELNPYVGCTGTAQTCTLWVYTNGTGSAATASISSTGAIFSKALATNQCVRSNASSVLATAGGDCVTSVSANSPLSSTGGTTPTIACSTCVTSVTASAPLSSSGGTNPNLTCSACIPVYNASGVTQAAHYVYTVLNVTLVNCPTNADCYSGAGPSFSGPSAFTSSTSYTCVGNINAATTGFNPQEGLVNITPLSGTSTTMTIFNTSSSSLTPSGSVPVGILCLGT